MKMEFVVIKVTPPITLSKANSIYVKKKKIGTTFVVVKVLFTDINICIFLFL